MKHFLYAFLLALALYVVFYLGIEHRRTRQGPWEVSFTNSPAGEPILLIQQPRLGISNVTVVFTNRTLSDSAETGTVKFDQAKPVPYDLPFGACQFMDITFLPGSVTLLVLGHQVELLPSGLIIDNRKQTWQSGETFRLESHQEPGSSEGP